MAFEKVTITVEHTGESFRVLFNPEEYTLNKENNFPTQTVPGLSAPLLQFVNGNQRTLEMDLLFDTYLPTSTASHTQRDVREETDRVTNLMNIDSDLHAPPILNVSWGSLQFRCVLSRVNQKFTMFLQDGTPVRARLTVTFNEYIDPVRESHEVNRQTTDYTKLHQVHETETLATIAHSYYEDPQVWRPIAIANGLDDPRAITVGQSLIIPSLPFVDPDTGEVTQ